MSIVKDVAHQKMKKKNQGKKEKRKQGLLSKWVSFDSQKRDPEIVI